MEAIINEGLCRQRCDAHELSGRNIDWSLEFWRDGSLRVSRICPDWQIEHYFILGIRPIFPWSLKMVSSREE